MGVALIGFAAAAAATVVLDPGHGGEARGVVRAGVEEAEVALSIALQTASELERAGLSVLLTRRTDAGLGLGERLAIAHRARADLFVSIHVNSSPRAGRRGVETYVASALGSDDGALVAREEGAVPDRPPASTGLESVVSELRADGARRIAARAAARIQARLARVDGLGPNRGLRQAPFTVLQRAEVPSVLVELGFMTNAEQRAFLASSRGKRAIASALARGIVDASSSPGVP